MSAVHFPSRLLVAQPLKHGPSPATGTAIWLAVALLACSPVMRADQIDELLREAERLAWLKNWTRAEPLYAKLEQHYRARGDVRNTLYAQVSRLRGQLPKLSL